MDRQTRRVTLIWVTVCVWSAAAAVSVNRFKLSAKSSVGINLITKPNVVRVSIDNDKVEGGAYLETPTKLSLRPGRHKLKIARDGYIAHIVTVDGDAGEVFRMEDVVLARNSNLAFATVDVQADDPPAHIEVDDGLIRGETPLTATDLLADEPHVLAYFPKWPSRDGRLKCKFTAPAPSEDAASYKIKFHAKAGKIKASGCDLLVPKRK